MTLVLNSYFILESDSSTVLNICKVFEEYPEFTCKGITEDYENGMNSILKETPDIVFVNVDLRDKNDHGDVFTYCKEIDDHIRKKPVYIALSLDKTKAYRALKNRFFDYIVKPGNELEIRKVVLQLIKNHQPFLNDFICLKSYKDFNLLEIDNVLFLKADNNATDFVLLDGKKVSAYNTLKSYESGLPGNFIRIHHSYIVNKNHISRINFGKLRCFLSHNEISLPFSKSYRHNLNSLEVLLSEKAMAFN